MVCGGTQVGIAVPGYSRRTARAAVSQEKAEKSDLLSPGLFKGLSVLFLVASSSSLEQVRSLKVLAQSKCIDPCGGAYVPLSHSKGTGLGWEQSRVAGDGQCRHNVICKLQGDAHSRD